MKQIYGAAAEQQISNPQSLGDVMVPRSRTVRENIDAQIAMHQEAISRLTAVKEQLGSILDIDTSTLRAAINW